MPDTPLPLPDSAELDDLGIIGNHRLIYNFLYERRDFPPTMNEIRQRVEELTGKADEQLDRRKRDLHKRFNIQSRRWEDGQHRHQLIGWADIINPDAHIISKSVRFQVLQSGRCARCGRTAEEDGVKLVVDHVIPQRWGGGNEITNLQPLCEDCNSGKKDYYGQFDKYAQQIREAVGYDDPHRRIAMILLAFNGEWVPSELIGAVASAKQYQEDWQKRLRELRYFGWDIKSKRSGPRGERVRVHYRAATTPELPEGNLSEHARRIERERSAANARRKSADS